MSIDHTADSQPQLGRIVMLVDNRVVGDSRVQKTAWSAAAAGWDVIVLGRSMDDQEHTWTLGRATVRLIPVPFQLATRRYEFRRPWLRRPFSYPPTGIAQYRTKWVKAWKADIRGRRAQLAYSGTAALSKIWLRKLTLQGETVAARALGRWVRFRTRQLNSARRARQRLDGPWDVLYTRFWQLVRGNRSWRRLEPMLWDYELAYGKIIDSLEPDLIHANDFRMLGVGARAKIRACAAGRQVKLVWDAHEFLPGIRPWSNHARWLPAHSAHEREYAPYADAVVTVSDRIAELLRDRHGLRETPTVVLNAPNADDATGKPDDGAPNLRDACGVGADVPLVVYSGAAAKQRGLDIMVETLPQLPGVHVAFVINRHDSAYVRDLVARSTDLGIAERIHILPYVEHWQVVNFLAAADAGVIPIHHWPNHELALITKFFEYSHARLPIVVSDVRTMAEMVRSTGQGEVFRAEDPADYVRAVQMVLRDPQAYRAAYEKPALLDVWVWERQAEILDGIYRRLVGGGRSSTLSGAELAGRMTGSGQTAARV